MTDYLDATLTLTTSDDPSVTRSIAYSALVAHSKVFSDMLSINFKFEGNDKSIHLGETLAQIEPLLSVIGGDEPDRESALIELDEAGWINLAKLADKYDCWTVRKVVEEYTWSVCFALE